MLVELFPRVHRRYTSLPILGPVLDGYGAWLLKRGYSAERAASTSARRRVSSAV